jgi:hypothetical protein
MRLSFCIFLSACVLSFIPAALDRGKTWNGFMSCNGRKKAKRALRLFGLWAIPLFLLMETLLFGYKGKKDANEKQRQAQIIFGLSDQLNNAIQEINVQSNAIASATPKPYKERLINYLNWINPNVIRFLRVGTTNFTAVFDSNTFPELEQLSQDPEGVKYISLNVQGEAQVKADGSMTRNVSFTLNPSLLEP